VTPPVISRAGVGRNHLSGDRSHRPARSRGIDPSFYYERSRPCDETTSTSGPLATMSDLVGVLQRIPPLFLLCICTLSPDPCLCQALTVCHRPHQFSPPPLPLPHPPISLLPTPSAVTVRESCAQHSELVLHAGPITSCRGRTVISAPVLRPPAREIREAVRYGEPSGDESSARHRVAMPVKRASLLRGRLGWAARRRTEVFTSPPLPPLPPPPPFLTGSATTE